MTNLPGVLAERLTVSYSQIAGFCKRWRIQKMGLFGSVVRDDFGPDSDIDVLAVYAPDVKRSLFHVVGVQDELAEMFGREVDFVEKRSLKNPFTKQEIFRSYRIIYPIESANFVALAESDPVVLEKVRNDSALFQMSQAAQESCDFIGGADYERFLADSILQGAVAYQLGSLGRAARRLSEGFRRWRSPSVGRSHVTIDWHEIIEWEAVVAYKLSMAVDLDRVWEIATEKIPFLNAQLKKLVPPLPNDERTSCSPTAMQELC